MAVARKKKKDGIWETLKTVFWALLIALAFRTILFQPFSIPAGSMKPTLLVGDYLFVSKYAYGYSHYSLPFAPNLFSGRIFAKLPERGDVVVFKRPGLDQCSAGPIESIMNFTQSVVGVAPARDDDCVDYIKRVIGLPGDTIQMVDGVLQVNGQAVSLEKTAPFIEPKPVDGDFSRLGSCLNNPIPRGGDCEREQWIETLPNGRRHPVLNLGWIAKDNTQPIKVKPGYIFFMGDNRDNSVDSRYEEVGQVPFENLIGRAEMVAISSEGAFWQLWNWRLDRFFKIIE